MGISWKSYLYPQTIARYSSPFNKNILIVETFGKLKLLVNGSPQSGPYIESLWKKLFKSKLNKNNQCEDILVLGIAGGTVIRLFRNIYPEANITAVDIDKTMVEIGKKYFGIDAITNLNIFISDAGDFVKKTADLSINFDMIVVDLFTGRHIPDLVSSDQFISNLKKILSVYGLLVINFLHEKEYKEKSDVLLDKLKKIFHSSIEKRIFLNRFFICQN